jgi:hypothetical protein
LGDEDGGDYPCWLIDKVIIDGTADPIIKLYANYWRGQYKRMGGEKTGEVSSLLFMGDKVSLQHTGQNRYRIEITKAGGSGFNYYKDYKIVYKE